MIDKKIVIAVTAVYAFVMGILMVRLYGGRMYSG